MSSFFHLSLPGWTVLRSLSSKDLKTFGTSRLLYSSKSSRSSVRTVSSTAGSKSMVSLEIFVGDERLDLGHTRRGNVLTGEEYPVDTLPSFLFRLIAVRFLPAPQSPCNMWCDPFWQLFRSQKAGSSTQKVRVKVIVRLELGPASRAIYDHMGPIEVFSNRMSAKSPVRL